MTSHTLDEQLIKYLADAHSIEEQALVQLKSAPKAANDDELATAFEQHLVETEGHEQLVRERLEAHGAHPSMVKDLLMRTGGMGFTLFAYAQPDTPGKLVAHAYSYEHLEYASYELLLRVARRAGDASTAEAAERIAGEEKQMGERLASLFDQAVEASLRARSPSDLGEQLNKYLGDAHAIEEQAIKLLEKAPELAGSAELASACRKHLGETREQQRLVAERLEARGAGASSLKDAAMRMGALSWAGFFELHPDTPGKLAAFAYAFEHLEIAAYEELKRVAERAGDPDTVALAERILAEERAAAATIEGLFDQAVDAALSEVVTG
jgi:ferritin-like metal-binding protein YciE